MQPVTGRLTTTPTIKLGLCTNRSPVCQEQLAVRQKNVVRRDANGQPVLRGDGSPIPITEDGQDLKQDPSTGRTNGKPALEWVVVCSGCGKEYRDHPHQRLLDESAAKAKATPAMRGVSMAELGIRYTSAAEAENEMAMRTQQTAADQARLTALESRFDALERKIDELLASRKGSK
jgi:hypothetical protein